MDRILFITACLAMGLILVVMNSLRREHIRVEYSVSWLAAAVVVLILAQWRGAILWLAETMGIAYPPSALASVAFAVFLFVLYRLSMIVSGLKDNNIALAQKVSILEFQIRELQDERKTQS